MLLPVVPMDMWLCLEFEINFLEVEDSLVSLFIKHKLVKFFLTTKTWKVAFLRNTPKHNLKLGNMKSPLIEELKL